MTVRRLATRAELEEATGRHPVAVLDVGDGFVGPAYAVGPEGEVSVVFHRRSDHGVPGTAAIGTASGLATLLDDPAVRAFVTGGSNRHLSVPRGLAGIVEARLDLGTRGGEWDWLWTRTAPPVVPGEEHVTTLDASHREETEAFLTAHSPRTHGQPFARPAQHWVAVRDAATGRLLATGCSEPCAAGTPTLAGIAVDTALRGEGWCAAVTAHLTRRAVAARGACALGMFADNDVARRVYERLGFTTGMRWTSRWFG
jgi:FR47-like protein